MQQSEEQAFEYSREFVHGLKNNISAVKLSIKLLRDSRIGTLNREQLGLVEKINDNINILNSGLTSIDKYVTELTQSEEKPTNPPDTF